MRPHTLAPRTGCLTEEARSQVTCMPAHRAAPTDGQAMCAQLTTGGYNHSRTDGADPCNRSGGTALGAHVESSDAPTPLKRAVTALMRTAHRMVAR